MPGDKSYLTTFCKNRVLKVLHQLDVSCHKLVKCGSDPVSFSLWQKMAKLHSSGQPPKWLSTHPPHEDRINDLRSYAAKVAPLYQAAKGNAAAGK